MIVTGGHFDVYKLVFRTIGDKGLFYKGLSLTKYLTKLVNS